MRLSGLDGAADEDPGFSTGFLAPGDLGLPSATAAVILTESATGKLQGIAFRLPEEPFGDRLFDVLPGHGLGYGLHILPV